MPLQAKSSDAGRGSRGAVTAAIVLVLLAGIVAAVVVARVQMLGSAPVVQPLDFNHAVHIREESMECTECHTGAKTGIRAGIPTIAQCNECHSEPQGDHPDEPKVREYAKAKRQIPFVQVNRNAGHVYFSHRAHVTFGEMKCADCHGDMTKVEKPVTVPTPKLHSMDACISCHVERQASLECAECHK